MPEKILLVDDTPANLSLLADLLEPQGYDLAVASSGQAALDLAEKFLPDLLLLDVMMPGLNGYEVCRRFKESPATAHIPILFISARDDATALTDAFRVGGQDYITKPFQAAEVLARVQTHLRLARLHAELRASNAQLLESNARLRDEIDHRHRTEDALRTADEKLSLLSSRETERWGLNAFVGKSKTIGKILQDLRRLQNFSSVNVLITGESGTGKELIARAIHYGSARAEGPFIPVNCTAIPTELAESMFFGHIKGSFTGAVSDRKGYFELAQKGTIFLDEIGDMPLPLQAKLLRVLEDGYITPVGATAARHMDIRVVAATNANIANQMSAATFRHDLYYRLAQFTVHLPPLRERKDDIPLLAEHFLNLFATDMGLKPPALASATLARLAQYSFPGNVRELKNIIERSLIDSADGGVIRPENLTLNAFPVPNAPRETAETGLEDLPLNLERAEAILTQRAMTQTNGNIAEAARLLGINRTRIYRKLHGETAAPE